MTETVVLTVGLAAYAREAVTLHDALETFTFGSTDDVDELDIGEDVSNAQDVAQFELSREVGREFDHLLLGSGSCLFEVPFQGSAGVFFFLFAIGKLYSGITIFFDCTHLRDNTRPSFNNSAWYILTLGTEDGNHSDFFSN